MFVVGLHCCQQNFFDWSTFFSWPLGTGSWFHIRCLELSPIYLDTNFLPHLKKKRKSIENCFVVLLWHHFIILWQKVTPKCVQSDVKVTPKWCQSDAKVMPKWCQSDAKVMLKWLQSEFKVMPKWRQSDTKMSKNLLIKWLYEYFNTTNLWNW